MGLLGLDPHLRGRQVRIHLASVVIFGIYNHQHIPAAWGVGERQIGGQGRRHRQGGVHCGTAARNATHWLPGCFVNVPLQWWK